MNPIVTAAVPSLNTASGSVSQLMLTGTGFSMELSVKAEFVLGGTVITSWNGNFVYVSSKADYGLAELTVTRGAVADAELTDTQDVTVEVSGGTPTPITVELYAE